MVEYPLVSVIMACYNHADYIGQAIESVLGQTYPNIEVLVLENGSTDDSYNIIKRYEDRIKILRLEKNDLLQAMEELRIHSSGRYIAIMTSDDYWVSDKIEKQVRILENDLSVKACFTWANVVNDEGNPVVNDSSGICSALFAQPNRTRYEWIERLVVGGNCLVFPSALLDRETYFSAAEKLPPIWQLHDMYTWMLILQTSEIYVIPEELVYFRWHTEGPSANASARTPKTLIRTRNEQAMLIGKYIRDMDDETFVKAFQKYFVRPDANGCQEIMCEKFFFLMRMAEIMIEVEQEVLNYYFWHNQYKRGHGYILKNALVEKYNYTTNDFVEYCAKHGFGHVILSCEEERKSCEEERNQMLEIANEYMQVVGQFELAVSTCEKQEILIAVQNIWMKAMAYLLECDLPVEKRLSFVRKMVYKELSNNTKEYVSLVKKYIEGIADEISTKTDEELEGSLYVMIENVYILKKLLDYIWTDFLSMDVKVNKSVWESVLGYMERREISSEYYVDSVIPFLLGVYEILGQYAD